MIKHLRQIWKRYSFKKFYYAEENFYSEMQFLPMGNKDTASMWGITFSWAETIFTLCTLSLHWRCESGIAKHSEVDQWVINRRIRWLINNNLVKWEKTQNNLLQSIVLASRSFCDLFVDCKYFRFTRRFNPLSATALILSAHKKFVIIRAK